jgi:arylesterase/paraoxonase
MRLLAPVVFLFLLLSLAAVAAVAWAGWTFRQFEEVTEAFDIDCTPVVGIAGAGDIEPLPGTPRAFLATFDRRGGAARGQLFLFDTEDPLDAGSWRDRTGGVPAAFVPSGLDLFQTTLPDGRRLRRLFVVNLAGPEVIAFDLQEDGSLALAERFTGLLMNSPNDVVATGPRSFYVTNDTGSGRKTVRGKAEFLLGLKTGSILRYDGKRWHVEADGLAFPNGLALSGDGRSLYVAETRSRTLARYDRDPATDAIDRAGSVRLEGFPNNLSVEPSGAVLVGSLPQPLSTSAYGEGLREVAASEVLRVGADGGIETVLRDPGERISAVTMATRLGDKLLVGTRADDKFLMCDAGP